MKQNRRNAAVGKSVSRIPFRRQIARAASPATVTGMASGRGPKSDTSANLRVSLNGAVRMVVAFVPWDVDEDHV
jgi:hypothetical protein